MGSDWMLVSVSPGSGESTEQAWTNGLARAIDAIGDPSCPGFLIDAISALVDFDMAMSVVYSRRAKPVLVHDGFTDAEARLGLSNYIDNTYVLNPLYTAYCDGIEEGVYRINELAPDEADAFETVRRFGDHFDRFVTVPVPVLEIDRDDHRPFQALC